MSDVVVDGKCPACRKSGMPSIVFLTGETTTLATASSFMDAEGRAHIHDMNRHFKSYRCSEGHRWDESMTRPCWCGFPDAQEND